MLTFDFHDIRCMTGTRIGTWAMDKMIRSAARHHQRRTPWLEAAYSASRGGLNGHELHHDTVKVGSADQAGITTLRDSMGPGAKPAEGVARRVYSVLAERGLQNEPVGVDIVEMPVLFAFQTYWPAKDGWGAARIEEEIIVRKDGAEVITKFPDEVLLVAGKRSYTTGGPLPVLRDSESHKNTKTHNRVESA